MSAACNDGDLAGNCDNPPTNSVFYFVTSVVALLILTAVVLFCLCCICLRRRRFMMMSRQSRNPAAFNHDPGTLADSRACHSQMEEGRLPSKKSLGVCVIMPGEASATFIAEPSSPVRTPKGSSFFPTVPDESSSQTSNATKS